MSYFPALNENLIKLNPSGQLGYNRLATSRHPKNKQKLQAAFLFLHKPFFMDIKWMGLTISIRKLDALKNNNMTNVKHFCYVTSQILFLFISLFYSLNCFNFGFKILNISYFNMTCIKNWGTIYVHLKYEKRTMESLDELVPLENLFEK